MITCEFRMPKLIIAKPKVPTGINDISSTRSGIYIFEYVHICIFDNHIQTDCMIQYEHTSYFMTTTMKHNAQLKDHWRTLSNCFMLLHLNYWFKYLEQVVSYNLYHTTCMTVTGFENCFLVQFNLYRTEVLKYWLIDWSLLCWWNQFTK